MSADAHRVRARLEFPVGISVNAPGSAPYRDAVWVGPEWEWRHGRYVVVPGHWERMHWRPENWVPAHLCFKR